MKFMTKSLQFLSSYSNIIVTEPSTFFHVTCYYVTVTMTCVISCYNPNLKFKIKKLKMIKKNKINKVYYLQL